MRLSFLFLILMGAAMAREMEISGPPCPSTLEVELLRQQVSLLESALMMGSIIILIALYLVRQVLS